MTVLVRHPVVAAFDFDGTLTHGESFFRFLAFVTPWPKFVWAFLKCLPTLLCYVLRLQDNESAKIRVLQVYLQGRRVNEVEALAERFAREKIPATLRPQGIAKLHGHLKQGHCCVLVSATLGLYLRPWARDAGFETVLATELAVDALGRYTGQLATPNCYGPEKARRLLTHFNQPRIIAAYGDSSGDTDMLALAEQPHFKPWR
jgi:phosphatidylglycerophosphatase C